jgi:hypothetical protein
MLISEVNNIGDFVLWAILTSFKKNLYMMFIFKFNFHNFQKESISTLVFSLYHIPPPT